MPKTSPPFYPFSPTTPCDICHALGSFTLTGDNLCALCLAEEQIPYDGNDETPTPTTGKLTPNFFIYPQRNE